MEIGALTKAKGRLMKGTPSDDVRAELGALHAWSSTKDADRDDTVDVSERDVLEAARRSEKRDMTYATSTRQQVIGTKTCAPCSRLTICWFTTLRSTPTAPASALPCDGILVLYKS